MSHIIDSCPLVKLDGGLSRLHSADDDVVQWLASLEGEPRLEKKCCHFASSDPWYEQSWMAVFPVCILPVMLLSQTGQQTAESKRENDLSQYSLGSSGFSAFCGCSREGDQGKRVG